MVDLLIFPHQLFEYHPGFQQSIDRVLLIEDSLFFGDSRYPLRFHLQKLWFRRATMKRYERLVRERGYAVEYLEFQPGRDLVDTLVSFYESQDQTTSSFVYCEPVDFVLEKRLERLESKLDIEPVRLPTPGFINRSEENVKYRAGRKRWFMADFYKWQRKRLDILMEDGQPVGGKWSFDGDNRKKVPKNRLDSVPQLPSIERDSIDHEAREYVQRRFPENPGSLSNLIYPTSHLDSDSWLAKFLEERFALFGDYEDAIVAKESFLWHSVLTPMLNVGLVTPNQVLDATLEFSLRADVPINALEGFIRQVIGWREFMRATYQDLGVTMRNSNHWSHSRSIPSSFYDGTTGIEPVDTTISRIIETGYCHHIERLMVLGGFMFLCEFHPKQIYQWFMEMFIDSYDWVMVPNVFAMSQHADGGLITTKPYFSGSAYIKKMSHYSKGPWCEIWDGLYWRWIDKNLESLSHNPRWAMMCRMAEKMDPEKMAKHKKVASAFLKRVSQDT